MLAVGLLLLAHAIVFAFQRRRELRRALRVWQDWRTGHGVLHTVGSPGWVVAGVWLLASALVGAVAVIALFGALAPEIEFDALWYHLEIPSVDLAEGGLVDRPEQYVSLYPQTVEMLYAYALGWQGVAAAKLLHFAFGLLTVVATYRLGRRWLSPPFALTAAAILVATPLVVRELRTAYLDLAVAFLVTVALLELLGWWESGERRRLWRSALVLGFALASKHLPLLVLPGALLLIGLGRERSLRQSLRALLTRDGLVPSRRLHGALTPHRLSLVHPQCRRDGEPGLSRALLPLRVSRGSLDRSPATGNRRVPRDERLRSKSARAAASALAGDALAGALSAAASAPCS